MERNEMQALLERYAKGEADMTPLLNISSQDMDLYVLIGEIIDSEIDLKKIPALSFLADRAKRATFVGTKSINEKAQWETYCFTIASFFTASALDADALKSMFGNPIYHDLFGEGFEGEYDEATDEYGAPEIKESYASYFVRLGSRTFHIGYDHRGTRIEMEIASKTKGGVLESEEWQIEATAAAMEGIRELINIYKEKAYDI